MTIEVEIPQLPAIERAWAQAPERARSEFTRAVAQSTIYVQGVARQEEPIRTGRLRSSTGISISGLEGRVGGPGLVSYAIYVHEGTGQHARGTGSGRTRRGGSRPNPFFDRAVRRSEPAVLRFFEQAADRLTAGIAGGN